MLLHVAVRGNPQGGELTPFGFGGFGTVPAELSGGKTKNQNGGE